MLIRNKLMLATTIPISLLILQVLTVNIFIRELQLAVQFIGAAQTVIEADFKAKDLVQQLRAEIRNVPQKYVQPIDSVTSIDPLWNSIGLQIELINTSSAVRSVHSDIVTAVQIAYNAADAELKNISVNLIEKSTDLNALLLLAITSNDALVELDRRLADLAVELRQQLQMAVDREQAIHDRPIIAGVVIGSLAVALLLLLVWVFVDRGIIRRLTQLSQSMLAIADGNLQAPIQSSPSTDEIGKMGEVLTIFRNNAVEIKESNLREVIEARKQRQFWLEHMASFLRHELKNKQVGAEQSIRLLLIKEGQNPQVAKFCERASTSLVEMKELINSTVDAADIESALLSNEHSIIDICDLLEQYTLTINQQISSRLVFFSEASGKCTVNGDLYRLQQMLDKLVSNAMDFRIPGTDVILRLTKPKVSQIAICVENQGPALPEDSQALFGLSVSVRKKEQKRQGNVGFGLFVARRIAEYHNGTIEATNSKHGPVFTVLLPIYVASRQSNNTELHRQQ